MEKLFHAVTKRYFPTTRAPVAVPTSNGMNFTWSTFADDQPASVGPPALAAGSSEATVASAHSKVRRIFTVVLRGGERGLVPQFGDRAGASCRGSRVVCHISVILVMFGG